MKLSLRKVKYYAELSEETQCYTAELYLDGKKVATVKNDGHGESTDVYYTEGWQSELAQKLERYVQNNPVIYKLNEHVCELRGVEVVVDEMFDKWMEKKGL